MAMSKRHFIALADVLRELKPKDDLETNGIWQRTEQWRATIDKIADFCSRESPRFKKSRWLNYINGISGPNGGAK